MKRRLVFFACTLGLALVAAWLLWRMRPASGGAFDDRSVDVVAPGAVADPAMLRGLHEESTPPRSDVRVVAALLRNYLQSVSSPDAPPLGFNEDVVRALGGENPLHTVFLPTGHPAVDRGGRLCDRWGTPYFFHPLAVGEIEVRSAGPDGRLFTADDLLDSTATE